jgi:polysaccharide pyruvyl transferase WcaK-like protein
MAARPGRPARVVTIGAALTGNKGAASMLQAVIDRLPERVPEIDITALSTYPDDDEREAATTNPHVRVVALGPRSLVMSAWPLALLAWIARRLGGTGRRWCRTPALRTLADADLVIDLAGISFVDGRGVPILAYNTLMTGLPLLLGRPTMKAAQALGPFRRPLNRAAARRVLPRLATIVARGKQTQSHLAELGLTNVRRGADLAFAMRVSDRARGDAASELARAGIGGPFIAISPSAVVERYCATEGIDYVEVMASLASRIVAEGRQVVVIPHSARPGRKRSRMNDLPLCHDIVHAAGHSDVRLLACDLAPAGLRAVIGSADALVTSRFHAMISALATHCPVLVVGWSHKYTEVLSEFGLEKWVIDWRDADADVLFRRLLELVDQAPRVRQQMAAALPAVERQALVSVEAAAELLDTKGTVAA